MADHSICIFSKHPDLAERLEKLLVNNGVDPLLLIRRVRDGAVLLLISGAKTILIQNSFELTSHLNRGIPIIDVGDAQFTRYNSLRGDL